jgi:hypothetical protein
MAADIYKFRLAWRWTHPSHNVLPADILAQIKPLEHTEPPDGIGPRGELNQAGFADTRTTQTSGSPESVSRWLGQLDIKPSDQITIHWDDQTAVETTWGIFAQFWDDFCYPSSDDVTVFPSGGSWILQYRHEESFEWARRQR